MGPMDFWEKITGKPFFHGKIDGFRLRFSQQNHSIDGIMFFSLRTTFRRSFLEDHPMKRIHKSAE
jgi:hypothetical protein